MRISYDEVTCQLPEVAHRLSGEETGMENVRSIRVGAARVTVINAGDLALRLADELAVPEEQWRPRYADLFERPQTCPSLSVLIQHAGATVLIDANDYRATIGPDSPFRLPDYTPPPDIPAQLAHLGVQTADVQHVIITHAHWDHFAGVTHPAGEGYVPVYPQAHYYLGAADWADAEMQAGVSDPASLEGRTLGLLHARGLLELVAEPREIAAGVAALPAPGETPGHLIVRVRSEGETLYVLGDLFHHQVEVEHPDWMVTWADAPAMLATRRTLMERALAENALLVAAHIASVGRLESSGDGARWQNV